ncbi:MAG: ribose-phosphate pyrophosphokinase [Pseudomonadota bacterium]|jgi:ribose-phosphate pyrophosphokinase|nr:ribose-phosphate pyrophosphokinase [Pseudomonadota bacterium]|tara:strand:- start:2532 stop:3488 length:957 start_codon:yes stop_codon:yes gene_type:complete
MNNQTKELIIFSGNANKGLSDAICKELLKDLGDADVGTFSDGEVSVKINENVRGKDVYLIQPTCSPTHKNLIELILMVDALRWSSAGRITAVIPYFGYARQDRRVRSERVPISAKVIADILERSGIDRVLTVELHSEQIQGFFDIPVDNIYGTKVMVDDINNQSFSDLLVVSPDVGGVVRSRALAKALDLSDLAIIDKRRDEANKSEVMNVIGEVAEKDCLIVDDMADTCGTLCNAAKALKEKGAKTVTAYITHPVLSGNAIEKINESTLDQLVVTDTIPLSEQAENCEKIRIMSLAPTLAEAIRRINKEQSISAMMR